MQAINHIATALILKKKVPSAPLFGLIVATEAVEFLWVGLNLAGIERTVIDDSMQSVADVHLEHMPFSHSIATSLIFAVMAGLFILWRGGKATSAVAIAIALAVISHIFLDLAVHAPDIVIAPLLEVEKYGTGLYSNLPLPALGLETLWGLLCWWIYRGNKKLLALLVVIAITSIPFYSMAINTGEAALGGQGATFAFVILAQMMATSALVWLFAKQPRATPHSIPSTA